MSASPPRTSLFSPRIVLFSPRMVLFSCWLLIAPGGAFAQPGSVSSDEIEARVRQIYIEGFPFEAGRNLAPDAVDRLGEMLESSDERPYWSNIVLALGASESPRALAALAALAARVPSGEVDGAVYQARVALPFALGHLARSQPEALRLLIEMAEGRRDDRGWRFQSLYGPALEATLRNSAITGLAVSGRPQARTAIEAIASRAAADPDDAAELLRHIDAARALHGRVATDGAERALERRAVRRAP